MLHGAACWFVGCAGCGLWALNVPVDVDATAPRALLLHFFMHCFVLASQREGGTGERVCMCASVHYIHMYMRIWIRRRGPPAVRCALSLALLSFV